MSRRLSLATGIATLAAGLAISACGSSNSSTSSNGSSSSGSSSSGGLTNTGGSFCDQTKSFIAQLAQLSKNYQSNAASATPNVNSFKQLFGAVTSAIDQLDSSAPGEIASAFHTMRAAYDQANSKAQGASSLNEIGTDFQGVSTQQVTAAGDQISAYLKNTCGINPSATP
jgi:hypothetical protein